MTRTEEIEAHRVATALSHLTQAFNWYRFAQNLSAARQLSLARCVELYAREAGRSVRRAGLSPASKLWNSIAPQAIEIHAISTAFWDGWQECEVTDRCNVKLRVAKTRGSSPGIEVRPRSVERARNENQEREVA
jgi:hypothetical protein